MTIPGALDAFGRIGCTPLRWWDASRVLVSCATTYHGPWHLWLVPAGGGSASALTLPPSGQHGYFLAWRLPSGRYVQRVIGNGCGSVIAREAADGSATTARGLGRGSKEVLAVVGNRMLMKWERTCSAGYSLIWLNRPPARRRRCSRPQPTASASQTSSPTAASAADERKT